MYDPLMLVIHGIVVIGVIAILVKVFQNGSKLNKQRDKDIRDCKLQVSQLRNQVQDLEEFNRLLLNNRPTLDDKRLQ